MKKVPIKIFTIFCLSLILLNLSIFINAQTNTEKLKDSELEGVYEFVSQKIKFTKPSEKYEFRRNEDWVGIWIFKDGYFSRTLVNKGDQNLGFKTDQENAEKSNESTTGKYQIKGTFITMIFTLSQHPITIMPEVLKFDLQKNDLTLTQTFIPNLHSDLEGEIVITLQRIPRK